MQNHRPIHTIAIGLMLAFLFLLPIYTPSFAQEEPLQPSAEIAASSDLAADEVASETDAQAEDSPGYWVLLKFGPLLLLAILKFLHLFGVVKVPAFLQRA